jgi:hypothetical protein
MKRVLLLIIISIIAIKGALAQNDNLVKNGSFENGNDRLLQTRLSAGGEKLL